MTCRTSRIPKAPDRWHADHGREQSARASRRSDRSLHRRRRHRAGHLARQRPRVRRVRAESVPKQEEPAGDDDGEHLAQAHESAIRFRSAPAGPCRCPATSRPFCRPRRQPCRQVQEEDATSILVPATGLAGAGAVVWQIRLMRQWRAHPGGSFYTQRSPYLWHRTGLFGGEWRLLLPSFYNFDRYLTYRPNLVAITVVAALAGGGVVLAMRRSSRRTRRAPPQPALA